MKPTIGRTVLFVLPTYAGGPAEVRPAVITKVWSDVCVNLCVLPDPYDTVQIAAQDQSSRCLSNGHEPGTWHWPWPGRE